MSFAPLMPADGMSRRSCRAAAVSSWSRSASARVVDGSSARASSCPGANPVRSASIVRTVVNSRVARARSFISSPLTPRRSRVAAFAWALAAS